MYIHQTLSTRPPPQGRLTCGRIQIRHGVKWSDGVPLTAKDVAHVPPSLRGRAERVRHRPYAVVAGRAGPAGGLVSCHLADARAAAAAPLPTTP